MTAPTPSEVTGVTAEDPGWDWLSPALERADTSENDYPLPSVRSSGVASDTRVPAVPAPRGVAVCALPAGSESARQARDFARATLLGWAADEASEAFEQLCDDVGLAVSELVGNAVRHGMRDCSIPAAERTIRLGLVSRGSSVLCAVNDPSDGVPVLREPDFLAETGRGLHVIAAVSGAWGWTPPDGSGKVVWATFPTPPLPVQRRGPVVP